MPHQGSTQSETTATTTSEPRQLPENPNLELSEAKLRQLEQKIEEVDHAFVIKGKILKYINENKLYRLHYTSFGEYCLKRWNISKNAAYQLIHAAEVMENLKGFSQKPANESQARKLAKLKRPVEQRYAWMRSVEITSDLRLTAAIVVYVVNQMCPVWHRWLKSPFSRDKASLGIWIPVKGDRVIVKDTHPQWSGLEGKIVDYYSEDEVEVMFDNNDWQPIKVEYLKPHEDLLKKVVQTTAKSESTQGSNLDSTSCPVKGLNGEIAQPELPESIGQTAKDIAMGLKTLSPFELDWVVETSSRFLDLEQLLAIQTAINRVVKAIEEKEEKSAIVHSDRLEEKEEKSAIVHSDRLEREEEKSAIVYSDRLEKEEEKSAIVYSDKLEEKEEISTNVGGQELNEDWADMPLFRYFYPEPAPAPV